EKSCRNITKQPISYFVNPSFPERDRFGAFCDYRIDISNKNVCQLRLDLEEFSLYGPHRTLGICRSDRFVAMTSMPNGIGISELCGENNGQHKEGGSYQTNLDYAICLQRSPNTCRFEFSQAENSIFWINSADGMYLEDGVGRAGTAACDLNSHDYLYIPGGRDGSEGMPAVSFSETTTNKFCGRSLSGLAITENADRMRSGYVLDPPDNNTLASTVTCELRAVNGVFSLILLVKIFSYANNLTWNNTHVKNAICYIYF
ncbi:hypothetical protein C0J52_15358, partial [Blattella germanica]